MPVFDSFRPPVLVRPLPEPFTGKAFWGGRNEYDRNGAKNGISPEGQKLHFTRQILLFVAIFLHICMIGVS
ncbi:hypothetical protein DUE52_13940 [Larkinella punicea]|uniref:Uncharacterized protein n=1 Tax=Larkinella punicea TaxID=2315727 RepID=A0A368JQW9_9BACT|nr:hypothetical protein DUE52_13940 [Larkinella punicea]